MAKVKRDDRITIRFSPMEILALNKLANDDQIKLSTEIRKIIHTSERYKTAYKYINQTLKQEVKE